VSNSINFSVPEKRHGVKDYDNANGKTAGN
jgi:hypothetical protein